MNLATDSLSDQREAGILRSHIGAKLPRIVVGEIDNNIGLLEFCVYLENGFIVLDGIKWSWTYGKKTKVHS